jgi:hypothetical protein
MQQRVVYAYRDLAAGKQAAIDEMCLQNLMSQVFFHAITPNCYWRIYLKASSGKNKAVDTTGRYFPLYQHAGSLTNRCFSGVTGYSDHPSRRAGTACCFEIIN